MAKENLGTDINGRVDFSLDAPTPDSCWDDVLAANTADSTTTPSNFNRAFFSYAPGTAVWVTLDGTTPIVPASGAASSQELNPGVRKINIAGGQTISYISDTASWINIRYDVGT